MPNHRRQLAASRPRRGYLYVAVLVTALALSTMGLAAISVATLRLRSAQAANDAAAAQVLAQSALEDSLLQIANNNNWRLDFDNDVENPSAPIALGAGSYTWKLVDDDGDLADDDSDSVRLVGVGRVGSAVAAESVLLLPSGQPLSCLESALHCEGDIHLASGIQFTTNQRISSNGNVSATGWLTAINGNVETVGAITGTVNGSTSSGSAPRLLPGSSVFDYYLNNGEWIDAGALPYSNSAYTLERMVLGPQHNPFGARNAEGVYVIDCAGRRVRVQNCRILGTLVLLDPGAGSELKGLLRWDAAAANYPALLVRGAIEVRFSTGSLSESGLNVNFNPPGAPFAGNEDADTGDAYPSEVNGLVYVSGTLHAPSDFLESPFRGVVAATAITANSACRFDYRAVFHDHPPPGFARDNPMLMSPGSRRRETLTP